MQFQWARNNAFQTNDCAFAEFAMSLGGFMYSERVFPPLFYHFLRKDKNHPVQKFSHYAKPRLNSKSKFMTTLQFVYTNSSKLFQQTKFFWVGHKRRYSKTVDEIWTHSGWWVLKSQKLNLAFQKKKSGWSEFAGEKTMKHSQGHKIQKELETNEANEPCNSSRLNEDWPLSSRTQCTIIEISDHFSLHDSCLLYSSICSLTICIFRIFTGRSPLYAVMEWIIGIYKIQISRDLPTKS